MMKPVTLRPRLVAALARLVAVGLIDFGVTTYTRYAIGGDA
jgi:hypothetical protein